MSESEFIPPQAEKAILECVRIFPGRLYRSSVAKILVGSKSARIARFQSHRLYSCLPEFSRRQVLQYVDFLLTRNVLLLNERLRLTTAAQDKPGSSVSREITHSSTLPENNIAHHVYLLCESGSKEHIAELINALNNEGSNVRRLAASALGKLKAQAAVQPLLDLLQREHRPQVRQYAIKALGKIGDPTARPFLERIRLDHGEMQYNQVAAAIALHSLRTDSNSGSPPLNEPSVLGWVPTRFDQGIRAETWWHCFGLGKSEAWDRLISILGNNILATNRVGAIAELRSRGFQLVRGTLTLHTGLAAPQRDSPDVVAGTEGGSL
jgi:hypothetical protein